MTTDKVRLINVNDHRVKFVTPLVAADEKQLFSNGWIIQNQPIKENVIAEPVKPEVTIGNVPELAKAIVAEIKEQEPLDLLSVAQETIQPVAQVVEKGKAGRKPNQK